MSIIPLVYGNDTDAAWYNSSWEARQLITISSSLTDENLANFPLLVAVNDGANPVFAHAQPDGDDILFTAADGVTKLSHEIEAFDPNTGQERLEIWVRHPVLSSATDTVVYMYYQNASAANQEAVSAVWDGDYVMVQHLSETSGIHVDSTANGNNGTAYSGVNQNGTGRIDGADSFDGSNDYIDCGTGASLAVGATFTEEVWIYPTATGSSYYGFLGQQGSGPCCQYRAPSAWVYQYTKIHGGFGDGSGWRSFVTGEIITNNAWNHVVLSFDGTDYKVYIDGVERYTSNSYAGMTPHPTPIRDIGRVDNYFRGTIDEVRISNTTRSPAWIEATFNITGSPATYLTFGEEETASCLDLDGDGYIHVSCGGTDCDDGDPAIHPGADEIACDGVDANCSGMTDEAPDTDADGFDACDPTDPYDPDGLATDCDDGESAINPGADEVTCDGVDTNCSGMDDEAPDADADGFDVCDLDDPYNPDGLPADGDDGDPLVNPGTDTVPPAPVQGLAAVPGDTYADLSWTAATEEDFDHYNVYQDVASMSDVEAMTPIETITDIAETALRVFDLDNGTTYWYAVTAVDWTGNEDTAVTSVSVTPANILNPDKIEGFTYTLDGDDATLSWNASTAIDFDHYALYQEASAITNIEPLTPVATISVQATTTYAITDLAQGQSHYFAVAVFDVDGTHGAHATLYVNVAEICP